jgi:hypothetical protein
MNVQFYGYSLTVDSLRKGQMILAQADRENQGGDIDAWYHAGCPIAYKADIDGGEGGDTIITAANEDEAMEKAKAWAAAGSWEPGNEYYVRLLDADGEEIRRVFARLRSLH